MTSAEIVKAMRCISAPAGDKKEGCESCPFYAKEKLDAEWAEKLRVTEWPNCDCDAVGIAAADLVERLEKEKAALVKYPKKLLECAQCANYLHNCGCDYDYRDALCVKNCPCQTCKRGSNWEWKGVSEG